MTEKEIQNLKKFAREVIKEICWDLRELDGGDLQEKAEKLGLIKSCEATKEDVENFAEFGIEVGDTIYKFTDMLKDKQ